MTRNELGLILFAFLYCGLTIAPKSAVAAQQPDHQNTATPEKTARGQNQTSESSNDGKDKPLITIPGLCDKLPADKDAASNCKTVITRAQFEKVLDAVEPGMALKARREFAQLYVEALVMSKKAEQMGLDKGPSYAEQMKLARIQILSRQLKKMLEEKSTQISDEDIEEYYRSNIARFEKAEMDRIYVPKTQEPQPASDKQLSDADPQKRSPESEQTMKAEADSLRARAIAGEDFAKLQADAYNFAGIKSVAPNTSIKVRRISLPPTQVAAMDLKPGEVSPGLCGPKRIRDLQGQDQRYDSFGASAGGDKRDSALTADAGRNGRHPGTHDSYLRRKLFRPRPATAGQDWSCRADKSHFTASLH